MCLVQQNPWRQKLWTDLGAAIKIQVKHVRYRAAAGIRVRPTCRRAAHHNGSSSSAYVTLHTLMHLRQRAAPGLRRHPGQSGCSTSACSGSCSGVDSSAIARWRMNAQATIYEARRRSKFLWECIRALSRSLKRHLAAPAGAARAVDQRGLHIAGVHGGGAGTSAQHLLVGLLRLLVNLQNAKVQAGRSIR